MAWIFISPAIPIALWDTHGKRACRDLDHRRTVFTHRWRDQGLRWLVGCKERGHVEQNTEQSRNKQGSDRHCGGVLVRERKREDRTVGGRGKADVSWTPSRLVGPQVPGFFFFRGKLAP